MRGEKRETSGAVGAQVYQIHERREKFRSFTPFISFIEKRIFTENERRKENCVDEMSLTKCSLYLMVFILVRRKKRKGGGDIPKVAFSRLFRVNRNNKPHFSETREEKTDRRGMMRMKEDRERDRKKDNEKWTLRSFV